MKMTKFNCVEMKRQGSEIIEKKTSGMTGEQEYDFWKEQTRNLKKIRIQAGIKKRGNLSYRTIYDKNKHQIRALSIIGSIHE